MNTQPTQQPHPYYGIPDPIREAMEAADKRAALAQQRGEEYRQACVQVSDLEAIHADLGQQIDELTHRHKEAADRLAHARAEAGRAQLVEQDTWRNAARYRRMAELSAVEEGIQLPPVDPTSRLAAVLATLSGAYALVPVNAAPETEQPALDPAPDTEPDPEVTRADLPQPSGGEQPVEGRFQGAPGDE